MIAIIAAQLVEYVPLVERVLQHEREHPELDVTSAIDMFNSIVPFYKKNSNTA